jgi:two-component system cell cycle sensor histidine kinase/response regulator CckA
MTVPSRFQRLRRQNLVVTAIVLVGVIASLVSFRMGRAEERAHAHGVFERRASLRHALIREVLGRYQDTMFGLSAVFTVQAGVSAEEFTRIGERIVDRIAGIQALEWVPVVKQEDRAQVEAALQRSYGGRVGEFIEFGADGRPRRAADRSIHYPILYVQPLSGNEPALGYDLMTGPTLAFLEQARQTRQVIVTAPIRLVQDGEDELGVVMICPVFRDGSDATQRGGDTLAGYLQGVFRVGDLLETTHGREHDPVLDMLFVDASERDGSKRVLRFCPAEDGPAAVVSEETFRSSLNREFPLPFGQRDWRVVFRPRPGWVEAQYTTTPLLRSLSLLLLSGLVAGLVHSIGRRTDMIRSEVTLRTAELAESRRHFANLLQALPGMAYRCTYDEQITVKFVSEGVRELTGWTPEEFVSGQVHFRDCIHPGDLARVREATRAALDEQRAIELEYRLCTRDGKEKWVLSRGRGVYEPSGELRYFEGLAIDITVQKKTEEARLNLERKLLEGQKLESLGLLAGGIAHDFNNLLSAILGNATLARMALSPSPKGEGHLRAIESASLRAAELCRQMLAYAGKGQFVIEPTDLTFLTNDLMPLLRVSLTQQQSLRLDLGSDLPAVLADPTQLRQIVMNLVLNAADAVAERGGEVRITTGVMTVDADLLSQCVAGADLPPGDYVFLEVKDTGSGMTKAVLAKIFDPFFTTKFAGRGLGLAAVLGIVRGHNGALHVQSAPGAGSSFRLLLPPTPSMGFKNRRKSDEPAEQWRSSARVLLVEDEEPVRVVAAEILKTYGMVPYSAEDGPTGLALFRQNPGTIDLVLLDLLMPGMSGEQTLKELRAIAPSVRVLLMSGYSEGDVLGRLTSPMGRLGFIAKPFTRADLERSLRELLED